MKSTRMSLVVAVFLSSSLIPAQVLSAEAVWTQATRLEAMKTARVVADSDINNISLRDVMKGPESKDAFSFMQEVTCTYQPTDLSDKGRTAKFYCLIDGEDKPVKVKYGFQRSEVFSPLAATRLFWALGFPVEREYAVIVHCKDCPEDPFFYPRGERGIRRFEPAVIERKFAGKTIEATVNQGWAFGELDRISEQSVGASVVQRDALKLLAGLVQHVDNGDRNQRLSCDKNATTLGSDGNLHCTQATMFVHDLGLTFGSVKLLFSYRNMDLNWWKAEPIWRSLRRCQVNIPPFIISSMSHPYITDQAREYLAVRLKQLSDRQIEDVFRVSRVEEFGKGTVVDWASTLKQKIREITESRCGD